MNSNEILSNGWGTVWRYPYLSRWIHQKTTLDVENWINKLSNQNNIILDPKIRYSINCMFFEKDYWNSLDNGNGDDETSVHLTAIENQMQNICVQSVPFVHLFFYSQREENKDLIPAIREYYQNRLNINYPISICSDKIAEIENRIKYIEDKNKISKYHIVFKFFGIKIKIRLEKY